MQGTSVGSTYPADHGGTCYGISFSSWSDSQIKVWDQRWVCVNISAVALAHRESLTGRFNPFVMRLVTGLSFFEAVSVCVSLLPTEGLLFVPAVGISIKKLNWDLVPASPFPLSAASSSGVWAQRWPSTCGSDCLTWNREGSRRRSLLLTRQLDSWGEQSRLRRGGWLCRVERESVALGLNCKVFAVFTDSVFQKFSYSSVEFAMGFVPPPSLDIETRLGSSDRLSVLHWLQCVCNASCVLI